VYAGDLPLGVEQAGAQLFDLQCTRLRLRNLHERITHG
jgi:hypothetical protein